MSWTFIPGISREALIQRLIAPGDDGTTCTEVLAHADQDDVLWSVERVTARQKTSRLEAGQSDCYLVCFLLDNHRGNWEYKAMEEIMHPYCYSCPLSFLDLAPERCPEWRQKVREYHQQHAA
jgi:hypothetical protein